MYLEGLAGESGQKCLEFEGVLKGEGIFCRSERGDPRRRPGLKLKVGFNKSNRFLDLGVTWQKKCAK